MKYIFTILLFTSFAAQATSPFMTVKERLRLDLWVNGVEEAPVINKQGQAPKKSLPEELERALLKSKL